MWPRRNGVFLGVRDADVSSPLSFIRQLECLPTDDLVAKKEGDDES